MALIEVHNLTHHFPNGTAGLNRVNLTVEPGEFVVIGGANGSGKSTLLKHLNGLLRPSEGEVRLAGRTITRHNRWARQIVGMVFQDADCQIVSETVRDDVAFGPCNLGLPPKEVDLRVLKALQDTGLSELADAHPQYLSGGEKRRLAIAGVLAMQPRILICDEPFANLDYTGVIQVLKQLIPLHQQGLTLLLTTHDVEKVLAHATRLIIMQQGRIVRDGAPADLLSELETFQVRQPCAARWGRQVESWLT